MPTLSGDFVRFAEWRRIQEFAAAAKGRDTPAALVVAGEPGAGKSTLWRAAVAAAADHGACVLRSEPSASEADAPFAGLADLLAAELPGVAAGIPARHREALEVALLIQPAGPTAPTAHAIGHAVLAALDSLLRTGPVLLAVDDAQWLDAGSLDALAFALRRLTRGPLSVLLAARTEAPADPLTVGVPAPPQDWRSLLTAIAEPTEIELTPLDAAQVQRLLPATATAAQARLVAAQSRGNPFWALEIWPDVATAPAPSPGDAPAPSRGRTTATLGTLARRFQRSLPTAAIEALTVVAAAERISRGDAVAIMRQGGIAEPVAAIADAIRAGAITESAGRLAPAHPLIGAAAIGAVPPVRRAGLYQQVAAVSASLERRAQFTALAAAAIGAVPDPDVANVLELAAEAASGRAATASAGKLAAQAVAFTPESDAAALVRRRIRAGELLFLASDLAGARAQLEALDLDVLATADLERALPLMADVVGYMGERPAATALITRAIETAGDDRRRHALVLGLASDFSYGIPGRRRESAVEAIRCAEAAGPAADRSLHRALVNLAVQKIIAGEGIDAELLDRAERIERRVPGIPLHDTADRHRGSWYPYTENPDAGRPALLRCIARSREAGEGLMLAVFLAYLARTEQLVGDYAKAATIVAEVSALEAAYDLPPSPTTLRARCEQLIAAGETGEALRLAEHHLPDEGQQFTVRFTGACLRGQASWWAGDYPAAVRHLELAARYADETGWSDPGVRYRIDHVLAEAYLATGRAAEAARISARLHEAGTRMNRPTLSGDAHRIDALAAAARGELEAAARCARSAVAAHEQSALRLELARSLLVLGRIERRRRDRPASRAALQRARELALAIGHCPLLSQVETELARTATARAQQPRTTLTDAELRVAEKIAKGATSREAATELFISPRTVETHMASVYRKLGVQSRLELRRALTGQ
jgi:DNA-binding CsgD family transcriptional regulator